MFFVCFLSFSNKFQMLFMVKLWLLTNLVMAPHQYSTGFLVIHQASVVCDALALSLDYGSSFSQQLLIHWGHLGIIRKFRKSWKNVIHFFRLHHSDYSLWTLYVHFKVNEIFEEGVNHYNIYNWLVLFNNKINTSVQYEQRFTDLGGLFALISLHFYIF